MGKTKKHTFIKNNILLLFKLICQGFIYICIYQKYKYQKATF